MNQKRGVIYLSKRVSFCAAHRLFNPGWSDEKNESIYGACARPGGHGHNYVLEVTVRGVPDPATGMVIDLKQVKSVVMREFWEKCDHRDMNRDVEFMIGRIPTAENIVMAAWDVLAPHLEGGELHRLRLHETDRNYVDYYGPDTEGDDERENDS